ncbi:hypothetical protein BDQ12DRAFT_721387 [Crucibulum laeve]|uniref:Mid2 domain-containing protein n=1 Tax=Crucibulum laeve TaxID=68775 RepID=A0A5C3M617_9AGAR|nr:hypothetical protein BDQ12DRAFT_721387 [Crucibulum laeve]
MPFFSFFLFGILALQTQAVLARLKFSFSDVQQCEPVNITFSGDVDASVAAMTLSILPLNSTPIFIPIPMSAVAPSGVYVTFLPLPAGATFIASLDDLSGENVAQVSDVIRVLPSPSGNLTCLSPAEEQPQTQQIFQLDNTPSQCENLTISYNSSIVANPPSVRLYSPKGVSFLLNRTLVENGTATYLLNFLRRSTIVLMIDDGKQNRQTTDLLTVGGDTSSDSKCISSGSSNNNGTNSENSNTAQPKTSAIPKAVIIGSASGGGAIFLVALAMIIYVLRERRKKQVAIIKVDNATLEKGPDFQKKPRSPPPTIPMPTYPEGTVKNPLYTNGSFLSPARSNYLRSSLASWSQVVPDDQRHPASQVGTPTSPEPRSNNVARRSDRLSLNSLDIEGMLNMATVQTERSSRQVTEPLPFSPAFNNSQLLVPERMAVPRPYPARRHLRDPSDVPADPTSIALSGYSMNPFGDDKVAVDSPTIRLFPHSPVTPNDRSLPTPTRPPAVRVGLPSSPSQGLRYSGSRLSGDTAAMWSPTRSSRMSAGDYYGIAR